MTTQEFSNGFDIGYNAIAGQSAPSIDIYEKSYYLTKAQLEIIKNHYDPTSNAKRIGFDNTEKRRVDLKELLRDYKTSTSSNLPIGLAPESRFFEIPDDVFLIVNESSKIISTDCDNNLAVNVKPVTYDEFDTQYLNPFKKPGRLVTWRVDMSKQDDKQVVELISPYNITATIEYRIRYLKYPNPIILDDLTTIYPSEELTIDGISAKTECELHPEIHPEILDRAIELALRDYKGQNLESKIQLDQRNE